MIKTKWNQFINRNNGKEWTERDMQFIMTCLLPVSIQVWFIGRNEYIIRNRKYQEATRLKGKPMYKAEPRQKLRIVKKGNKK